MSDQNAQQEPSMEEILASIRRIISEDGDEDNAAAPEAEAEAPEPVAADPEPVAEAPEPVEEAVAPEPEEDVLELTDEVQDRRRGYAPPRRGPQHRAADDRRSRQRRYAADDPRMA